MTNLTLLPEVVKRVVSVVAVTVLFILISFLYGCTSKTGDVEYELKVRGVYYEEEGEEIENEGMIAPLFNEDYTVVVQISHNDEPFTVLHIINGNNIQIPMSADEDPRDNWFQYTMVKNAGEDNSEVVIYVSNEDAETDTFHFTVVPGAFRDGDIDFIPSDTYVHDNDEGTLEVTIKDATDQKYWDKYDTAQFWINNKYVTEGPPGSSLEIYDTTDKVGDRVGKALFGNIFC